MRIEVKFSMDLDETHRRAIRCYMGDGGGLATRGEAKRFFEKMAYLNLQRAVNSLNQQMEGKSDAGI